MDGRGRDLDGDLALDGDLDGGRDLDFACLD